MLVFSAICWGHAALRLKRLQVIGRRNADADVIAASAAFERIRPWANTYRICHKTVAAAAAGSNGANGATNGLVF